VTLPNLEQKFFARRRMTAKKITGSSPVTFISEDETTSGAGLQRQIPLSLITYDDTLSSPVAIANNAVDANDMALASSVISALIKQGILTTID
jgi:hypothetical protein